MTDGGYTEEEASKLQTYTGVFDPRQRAELFCLHVIDQMPTREQIVSGLEKLIREVISESAFDKDGKFDDRGVDPEDLEPYFCEAMSQLTTRQAYAKGEVAQLIAEKAKLAVEERSRCVSIAQEVAASRTAGPEWRQAAQLVAERITGNDD